MPAFSWTIDVKEAESEQRHLRELVSLETSLPHSLHSPYLDFESGIAIGTSYDENTKRCFEVGCQ